MCERFGESSALEIDKNIIKLTPVNTLKARASAWKQFEEFCSERNYTLNQETTLEQLAMIMKDFAFNMRKTDGTDYKEQVVKTLWNTVAKVLQEKYHNEYNPHSTIHSMNILFCCQCSKTRIFQVVIL